MSRGQEDSFLDLALPPAFHKINGNHITFLSLNSEANVNGCQEPSLSLHVLLAGRTPILVAGQPPLNSKMTTSQAQGMNINYGTSITLTGMSINMDMLSNLANKL